MTEPIIWLFYDERMAHHHPLTNHFVVVETPQRIVSIKKRLDEVNHRIVQKRTTTKKHQQLYSSHQPNSSQPSKGIAESGDCFLPVECYTATKEAILLVHSEEYYESVRKSAEATDEQLVQMALADHDGDMYYNKNTFQAATLACGGVINCVNAVLREDSRVANPTRRAIAVVRPPGHHACQNHSMGFCFFNSVVVAAKYAVHSKAVRRVIILDWDIHHGNGTQDLTYDDPHIFYISLHRKGRTSAAFFPGTGSHTQVGSGEAEGMNLNIPWTKGGVGNIEYAAAFSELILPLMIEFEPDLVLISSGFDAAKGDLLGDCELTPEMYYCMTKSILLALGEDVPIVIALEGGYNVDVNCDCMEAVSLALLNEPWERKVNEENCKLHDNNQCRNPKLPQDCSSRKNTGYKGERLAVSRKVLSQFWDYVTINDKQKGCGAQSTAIKSINQSMVAIQNSIFWRDKEVHLSQVNTQNRLNKKKLVKDIASLENVSDALKRMVLEK